MTSTKIPLGSFWAIKKPFDPLIYFANNGFKLINQEKYTTSTKVDLKKLWQRKYLFFGDFKAISMESADFFFFYEQHHGQLYHCDLPNSKISKITNQQITCFFWYPEAKSCGLKIYADNQLIRHIESESDYTIINNKGSYLENEDEIILISNTFNEQQLAQYIWNAKIDLPEQIPTFSAQNTMVYTIVR